MANYVFKKNSAGIKKLLQSDDMLKMCESEAKKMAGGEKVESFVGFDRAKAIIGRKSRDD